MTAPHTYFPFFVAHPKPTDRRSPPSASAWMVPFSLSPSASFQGISPSFPRPRRQSGRTHRCLSPSLSSLSSCLRSTVSLISRAPGALFYARGSHRVLPPLAQERKGESLSSSVTIPPPLLTSPPIIFNEERKRTKTPSKGKDDQHDFFWWGICVHFFLSSSCGEQKKYRMSYTFTAGVRMIQRSWREGEKISMRVRLFRLFSIKFGGGDGSNEHNHNE